MTLTINNISKAYGKTMALTKFSAELSSGIYGLLGPNGSGKSTLMNIITDNLNADSGEILFNGENVIKLGAKFREKLGFMPQYPGMYPTFTVSQFMYYMASLKDIDKISANEQIKKLLMAVELSDVRSKRIKALSGGMKQRLGLAQALLGNPEVVILDEPTAGLDPKQRIIIRNYISSIALNKIVIIATHIVSDIEYIAKEIIFLKKGIIIDFAPPHDIIKKVQKMVWNVTVNQSDVAIMQNKFKVLNINNSDSGIFMRILSKEKPADNAEEITPTLEDYYLYIFGDVL